MNPIFPNLTVQQSQYVAYGLVAAAALIMFSPPEYQMYIPVQDMQTKQIIAVVAILAAYYFYNGQKF